MFAAVCLDDFEDDFEPDIRKRILDFKEKNSETENNKKPL